MAEPLRDEQAATCQQDTTARNHWITSSRMEVKQWYASTPSTGASAIQRSAPSATLLLLTQVLACCTHRLNPQSKADVGKTVRAAAEHDPIAQRSAIVSLLDHRYPHASALKASGSRSKTIRRQLRSLSIASAAAIPRTEKRRL